MSQPIITSKQDSIVEVEQTVLGTLIIVSNAFELHSDRLSLNLFTEVKNQRIFSVLQSLYEQSQPLDMVTVNHKLSENGDDSLCQYVIELALKVSSAAHLEYYIMILVEAAVKRDFAVKFQGLTNLANKQDTDVFSLREQSLQTFDSLFIEQFIDRNKATQTFAELVLQVQDKFEKITQGVSSGLQTSFGIINRAIGGWQDSDLTIVAGRPGMGKTAFMVQSVIDLANQGLPVGAFSLEMSAEQITARLVTNYTDIPNSSLLRKGLKDYEIDKYLSLRDGIMNLPIHIDDTPAISIQNLRLKAKMMKIRYGIKALFIDYLQLITNDSQTSNREQEITKISQGLKRIAKELNIPVISLSQLNRKLESRPDKRPMLSDLRDSGSIEQDADEVLFLYRPEYYGIETWGDEYNGDRTENTAEIIIQKNRQGGTLSERVGVNMSTSTFYDLNLNY